MACSKNMVESLIEHDVELMSEEGEYATVQMKIPLCDLITLVKCIKKFDKENDHGKCNVG